ncbi:hypothetical protein [Oceanospirillum maris]|uniref:hypothetical protein n=1 Tax=Oceanospirillum maris TaxID=64977 RepID=UPI0004116C4D|nr:hypothetical protein [Oceanospirillum maris]
MSRQSRNPFLRLPVCEGNDVIQRLIHADHILEISENDERSCNIELVNGKIYLVEFDLKTMELLLNQAFGHELARPSRDL